jgi:magnesium transporter
VENLPSASVAALFESVSPRLAGPVLAAMLPPAAARLIARMRDEHALALLSAAGTQTTVAVLRYISDPVRTRLLTTLPAATGLATQLLLGFPDDTVGAWTDPDVIAAAPAMSVRDALRALRDGDAPDADAIYVVDAMHRLQGEIALPILLRAPDASSLGHLLLPSALTLSPRMPIASVSNLTQWQRAATLPVVDHENRLLGILRRTRLAQAVRQNVPSERESRPGASVVGLLAGGYWVVVSGLASASLSLLPEVQRVQPGDS